MFVHTLCPYHNEIFQEDTLNETRQFEYSILLEAKENVYRCISDHDKDDLKN